MNKKYLFVLALPLLLVGCNQNNGGDNGVVHFETGYSDITIADVQGEKVTRPSISGMTVQGFYKDENFVEEFEFDRTYSKNTTVYVKGLKGAGTLENPYLIESSNSFKSVAYNGSTVTGIYTLTKSFSLTNDYSSNYDSTVFNGTLDGNGYTITLNVHDDNGTSRGDGETGLFNKIGETGLVKNLKIVGAIEGSRASTGSVANINDGSIENIETFGVSMHASNGYNSGVRLMTVWDENNENIVTDHGRVGILEDLFKGGAGGIAGTNNGTIIDSVNRMNVQATIGAGGIAAFNYGTIKNCINKGAVGTTGNNTVNSSQIRDHEFDFSYLGGISGANFGLINQCGNTSQIFVARLPWKYNDNPVGQNDYINRIRIGGIVGYNKGTYDVQNNEYTKGIVTECFNYGRVHGDMQVGGIAGYTSGYIADCQAICPIGARYCLGGIAGWMSGDNPQDRLSVVTRCLAITRIAAGSDGSYVDELGNSVPGVKLLQLSSSQTTTNIVDYYHIAKYATQCVYHNYGGTSKPLDPVTGELDSKSTNTTATISDSAKRNVVALVDGSDSGLWASFIDSSLASAVVGFNSSWQAYLNVILSWQKKTITFVSGNTTTEVDGVVGIDYVNTVVEKKSGYYTGPLSSNYSCACGEKLPKLNSNQVWAKEDGTIWDGLLTGSITVHAINK